MEMEGTQMKEANRQQRQLTNKSRVIDKEIRPRLGRMQAINGDGDWRRATRPFLQVRVTTEHRE